MKLLRRKFCECGCGQVVNKGRRFILNHWDGPMKGKHRSLLKRKFCKCGCGGVVMNRRNKYIDGHYVWMNPLSTYEAKEKYKKTRNTPEFKRMYSLIKKEMWDDPEFREKMKNIHINRCKDPEVRKRLASYLVGKKSNLGFKHTEETKKKFSEYAKKQKLSPEHKRKLNEGNKKWVANLSKEEKEERYQNLRYYAAKGTATSIEKKICNVLDNYKIPYQTNVPIWRYFADIYVPSKNLVIECDGDYWHSLPDQIKRDGCKDRCYKRMRFNSVRLKEYEIKFNPEFALFSKGLKLLEENSCEFISN